MVYTLWIQSVARPTAFLAVIAFTASVSFLNDSTVFPAPKWTQCIIEQGTMMNYCD